MAFESTVSPLGAMAAAPPPPMGGEGAELPQPDDGGEDEEEQPSREPKERIKKGSLADDLIDQIEDINLARYIEQDELDRIGMLCVDEYRIDDRSRTDWVDKAEKAMKFAVQDTAPKNFPWPGASNFIFPLITQATIEFAARTYPAIIQNRSVVKGVIWGSDDGTPMTEDGDPTGKPIMMPGMPEPMWKTAPGEKRERANRVGEHMSWQLLVDMPEWEPQTDQMLHQIPVVGGAARKTFYDELEGRPKSLFVSLLNLVWNYHAPSFETAPRHSEKVLLYPNQIADLERTCEDDCDYETEGGMFLPLNYGPAGGGDEGGETFNGQPLSSEGDDDDAPHLFIEQHRRLDLDKDGYPEPYIVTVHLRSCKVVRIVARYEHEHIKSTKKGNTITKIDAVEMYTLYPFLPSIDGGSYPMGFGQLLRPLNEGINTSLNQMFDAGTLANAGGGFISDQLGLPSGQTLFQVGKYTRVTTKGAAIKDAVYPLPFLGANATLFQVLGLLITSSKEMAGIGNILTGDSSMANAPPTTVLALIEQGMKFYTAITKRIFRAEKMELSKLYSINCKQINEQVEYRIGNEVKIVKPEDYGLGSGVEPVADPTMTTDMQKLGRAQVVMSIKDEEGVDKQKVLIRFLEAANIDRPEDLMAPPNPQAQQIAQTMQQIAVAQAQAELGSERAKELKDQTQAFLNMSLARKNANAQQEAFIDAQLNYMRLRIEALNTSVKAASIDHKFHDTDMRRTVEEAKLAANDAGSKAQNPKAAAQLAEDAMASSPTASGLPVPAPEGPFPVEPGAAGMGMTPGPAATGPASASTTPTPGPVAPPAAGPSPLG